MCPLRSTVNAITNYWKGYSIINQQTLAVVNYRGTPYSVHHSSLLLDCIAIHFRVPYPYLQHIIPCYPAMVPLDPETVQDVCSLSSSDKISIELT